VRRNEAGGSTLSSIVWLAILVGVLWAIFNVAPAYMAHYNMQDKMREVARMGISTNPDNKIMEVLMKHIRDEGLSDFVQPANFRIQTGANRRRITLDYEREVKVLPGVPHIFKFSYQADEPTAY
jgi:hypothetical protein